MFDNHASAMQWVFVVPNQPTPRGAHSCAFCGYAVQLDNSDLRPEAAHIRWFQLRSIVADGRRKCRLPEVASVPYLTAPTSSDIRSNPDFTQK